MFFFIGEKDCRCLQSSIARSRLSNRILLVLYRRPEMETSQLSLTMNERAAEQFQIAKPANIATKQADRERGANQPEIHRNLF